MRSRFFPDFSTRLIAGNFRLRGDAETEHMPQMLRPVAWPEVKKAILAEVRRVA